MSLRFLKAKPKLGLVKDNKSRSKEQPRVEIKKPEDSKESKNPEKKIKSIPETIEKTNDLITQNNEINSKKLEQSNNIIKTIESNEPPKSDLNKQTQESKTSSCNEEPKSNVINEKLNNSISNKEIISSENYITDDNAQQSIPSSIERPTLIENDKLEKNASSKKTSEISKDLKEPIKTNNKIINKFQFLKAKPKINLNSRSKSSSNVNNVERSIENKESSNTIISQKESDSSLNSISIPTSSENANKEVKTTESSSLYKLPTSQPLAKIPDTREEELLKEKVSTTCTLTQNDSDLKQESPKNKTLVQNDKRNVPDLHIRKNNETIPKPKDLSSQSKSKTETTKSLSSFIKKLENETQKEKKQKSENKTTKLASLVEQKSSNETSPNKVIKNQISKSSPQKTGPVQINKQNYTNKVNIVALENDTLKENEKINEFSKSINVLEPANCKNMLKPILKPKSKYINEQSIAVPPKQLNRTIPPRDFSNKSIDSYQEDRPVTPVVVPFFIEQDHMYFKPSPEKNVLDTAKPSTSLAPQTKRTKPPKKTSIALDLPKNLQENELTTLSQPSQNIPRKERSLEAFKKSIELCEKRREQNKKYQGLSTLQKAILLEKERENEETMSIASEGDTAPLMDVGIRTIEDGLDQGLQTCSEVTYKFNDEDLKDFTGITVLTKVFVDNQAEGTYVETDTQEYHPPYEDEGSNDKTYQELRPVNFHLEESSYFEHEEFEDQSGITIEENVDLENNVITHDPAEEDSVIETTQTPTQSIKRKTVTFNLHKEDNSLPPVKKSKLGRNGTQTNPEEDDSDFDYDEFMKEEIKEEEDMGSSEITDFDEQELVLYRKKTYTKKRNTDKIFKKKKSETLKKITSWDSWKENLTVSDLMFINPTSNPMTVPPECSKLAVKNEVVLTEEEDEEEVVDNPEPVPQLKIGADGKLIIDPSSLIIEETGLMKNKLKLEKSEAILESKHTVKQLSNIFQKKTIRKVVEWSAEETLMFYRAINTIGTDFTMITTLFKNKTRADIKKKFKYEERKNESLLMKTLTNPNKFDIESLKTELLNDKVRGERVRAKVKKRMERIKKEKKKAEKPERKPRFRSKDSVYGQIMQERPDPIRSTKRRDPPLFTPMSDMVIDYLKHKVDMRQTDENSKFNIIEIPFNRPGESSTEPTDICEYLKEKYGET